MSQCNAMLLNSLDLCYCLRFGGSLADIVRSTNLLTYLLIDFCWFQAAFDDIALFFYDVYGGNYVGVVWKLSAAESENQLKV